MTVLPIRGCWLRMVGALVATVGAAGCGGGSSGPAPAQPPEPPPLALDLGGLECSGPGTTGWCWQAPLPPFERVSALSFVGATGIAGGASGLLQRSTDGGASWQRLPRGAFDVVDLALADPMRGWLRTHDDSLVLRTTDGGLSWHERVIGSGPQGGAARGFERLLPVGPDAVMLLRPPGIGTLNQQALASPDAGVSWHVVPAPYTPVMTGGVYWAAAQYGLRGLPPSGPYRITRHQLPDATGVEIAALPDCSPRLLPVDALRLRAVCTTINVGFLTPPAWPLVFDSADGGMSWQPITPRAEVTEAARLRFSAIAIDPEGQGLAIDTGTDLQGQPRTRLLRISEGASRWQLLALPPALMPFALPDAALLGPRALWLVGGSGQAHWTDDGGLRWQPIHNPAEFGRPDRLLIEGDTVLAEYWGVPRRSDGSPTTDFRTRHFYRSTDRGTTWHKVPGGPGPEPTVTITAMWWFDTQRGLALASDGSVRRSGDGGRSWLRGDGGTPKEAFASLGFNLIRFVDGRRGLMVERGRLRVSEDGGATWSAAAASDATQAITDLQVLGNGTVLAAAGGRLQRSLDGGRTWEPLAQPGGQVRHLRFFDADIGVVHVFDGVFYESVWFTRDGGRQWAESNIRGMAQLDVTALRWADADHVWMSGGNCNWRECLWSSADGGRYWRNVPALAGSGGLVDMHFADPDHGWLLNARLTAAGAPWLYATTDGGRTWSGQGEWFIGAHLQTMFWLDRNVGWAGGEAGAILATHSGGR